MKFKEEIKFSCHMDAVMIDADLNGFILIIRKDKVNEDSQELLVNFAEKNRLNLLLDEWDYIISTDYLTPVSAD